MINEQKRIQFLLMMAIISIGMGQFIVFAVLAPLIRSVGLQEYHGGLIISFSSIVFAFSSGVWGRLSSFRGRRRVMLIGLCGYCGGTILFTSGFYFGLQGALTGTLLFLFLAMARMAQSTLMGATNPAATAYMADITTTEQRVKGMAKIGSAHSIGTILGPALAAPLIALHLLAPLVVAAIITAVAALLIWFKLPEIIENKTPRKLDIPGEIRNTLTSYFDTRYRSILLVGVLMFLGYAMSQQTIGYLVQDKLNLTADQAAQTVAQAFMFSAVFALLSQTLIVQRLRLSPTTLLFLGLPLMMAGYASLAMVDARWIAVASYSLIGLGMGMTMPGFMAASSMAVEADEQGAIAGVVSGAPALGFILGPTIGAFLYQWKVIAPNLAATAINAFLIVYLYRYLKRPGKAESQSEE